MRRRKNKIRNPRKQVPLNDFFDSFSDSLKFVTIDKFYYLVVDINKDDQRSQYLWFNIGWKNERRVKAISVYVRIKNEKIYIEEDWTEEGIATEFVREGVPKEDIVLASHDL